MSAREGRPSRPLRTAEVARRLNVTIDTLRSWERDGLIAPPLSPRRRALQR